MPHLKTHWWRTSTQFKKGNVSCMKGKHHTEETKRKIGLANKGKLLGKKNPFYGKSWNKGLKGYKAGKESLFWKGGISSLREMLFSSLEYKEWKKSLLKRDGYTCRRCPTRTKLDAHHLKFFSLLLQEFLQTYHQFSPIEDKETLLRLAITYEPFWDINNGIILCRDCHIKEHKKVGCENSKN